MMNLISQFVLALFATMGFAVIFRVPARHIPACVIVGACMVGLCSAVSAHIFKEAMTIFIIPGILCLVPGANIFYTMEALLRSDIEKMAEVGIQTILMAGAIAMGLLAMGAVINVVRALLSKTISIKDKL